MSPAPVHLQQYSKNPRIISNKRPGVIDSMLMRCALGLGTTAGYGFWYGMYTLTALEEKGRLRGLEQVAYGVYRIPYAGRAETRSFLREARAGEGEESGDVLGVDGEGAEDAEDEVARGLLEGIVHIESGHVQWGATEMEGWSAKKQFPSIESSCALRNMVPGCTSSKHWSPLLSLRSSNSLQTCEQIQLSLVISSF